MKRMVHIVGAMAPGGLESFIMNIYREIDRKQVQFDFIVHDHPENSYEEEIKNMGGRIFTATRKSKSILKNFSDMYHIIKKEKFDAVFRHSDNAFAVLDLLAAKWAGASKIIMHSHSTSTTSKKIHTLFKPWISHITTHNFACSQAAGIWMFGKKKFQIIPNAIDSDKFSFNQVKRVQLREKWNISQKFIVGHVGNFVYAKNHMFLLEVFKEIVMIEENAILVLVGDGQLRKEIEEKIIEIDLKDKVHLVGIRNDIPDLLQVFDVFLFPSIYEGLPVAVVEAQTSGLNCFLSDNITKDVALTTCVQYISLSQPPKQWAKEILEKRSNKERISYKEEIKKAHYDIKELVKFYEEFALQ